jgi:hypothetical protein
MEALKVSSNDISKFIKTVDEIALKTNMDLAVVPPFLANIPLQSTAMETLIAYQP